MNQSTHTPDNHSYTHLVQYYETDSMQIVHHSNYIRWMEEARMDYLASVGLPYDQMEARGIIVPVLSASCDYKVATHYGETVNISVEMESFNGLRFSMLYRITSMDGKRLHATGRTSHCFLDKDMKPVNIKKAAPYIYDFFKDYL